MHFLPLVATAALLSPLAFDRSPGFACVVVCSAAATMSVVSLSLRRGMVCAADRDAKLSLMLCAAFYASIIAKESGIPKAAYAALASAALLVAENSRHGLAAALFSVPAFYMTASDFMRGDSRGAEAGESGGPEVLTCSSACGGGLTS